MIIRLKAFQLFKSAEFTLGKLNAITGTNLDNLKNSSNGSGKSTLCKNAITFGLYGDIPGLSLDKIIHDDEKECSVTIECSHNSKQYQIIRKIPTSLQIFENGIEVQLNSIPLKEVWIDRVFGDYNYFKKYRMIDLKGTNLLDNLNNPRSIVTLKKELMSFVDDLFITWRNGLLKKKTERETFNKDKRLYKFHLSDRRLKSLEDGLKRLNEEKTKTSIEIDNQSKIINNLKVETQTKDKEILSNTNQINQNKNELPKLSVAINDYQNKISILNKIDSIKFIDYSSTILDTQKIIDGLIPQIKKKDEELLQIQEITSQTQTDIEVLKTQLNKYREDITKLTHEIQDINQLTSGAKCDKCGAIITIENKKIFLQEQNIKINQLEQQQDRATSQLNTNNINQKNTSFNKQKINNELIKLNNELKSQQEELKSLNTKNTEQLKQKEKQSLKESEIKKYNELCSFVNKQILDLNNKETELQKEITQLNTEKQELLGKLEEVDNGYLDSIYTSLKNKIDKTSQCLMKLKEAFKFAEYKYTAKDAMMYTESIKVLDEFSSYYINEWLGELAIIVNDLLKNINITIQFTEEKEFMKVMDNGKAKVYAQLSSGQKTMLSAIFKLAILIHKNETEGIILCDEGFDFMDEANLENFIEVVQPLNFQIIFVYQDLPEMEGINRIDVLRQNNESRIQ